MNRLWITLAILLRFQHECKGQRKIPSKVDLPNPVSCHGSRCDLSIKFKFWSRKIPTPSWQKRYMNDDGSMGWKDISGGRYNARYIVYDKNDSTIKDTDTCPFAQQFCYVKHTLLIYSPNTTDLGTYLATVESEGETLTFRNLELDLPTLKGVEDTSKNRSLNKEASNQESQDSAGKPFIPAPKVMNQLYIIIGGVAGGVVVVIVIVVAFLCGKHSTINGRVKDKGRVRPRDRDFSLAVSSHMYDEIASSVSNRKYDELDEQSVNNPHSYSHPASGPVGEDSPLYRDPQTMATQHSVNVVKTEASRSRFAKKDSQGYLEPGIVSSLRRTNIDNPSYLEPPSKQKKKVEATYSNSEEVAQLRVENEQLIKRKGPLQRTYSNTDDERNRRREVIKDRRQPEDDNDKEYLNVQKYSKRSKKGSLRKDMYENIDIIVSPPP